MVERGPCIPQRHARRVRLHESHGLSAGVGGLATRRLVNVAHGEIVHIPNRCTDRTEQGLGETPAEAALVIEREVTED